MQRAGNWRRLDGVDLLRGLSITLVLLNHVNMQLLFAHVPYTRGWPAWLVLPVAWSGQYGVQMFFAVSGFLITATSLRRWGRLSDMTVRAFYGLRFARIVPLLLSLLALLSVLDVTQVPDFVVRERDGGLNGALGAALTLRVNWLEAHRGYLPGAWDILWSLSVEEVFYLVFPWACVVLRGRWLRVLLVILVALGPLARTVLSAGNPVWREYSYLGSMDAIAMGCLTALWLGSRQPGRTQARWIGAAGALLMGCVLCRFPAPLVFGMARVGLDMSVLSTGACLWIGAAAMLRGRAPALARPLAWLGQRSYEVYLTHIFVVLTVFAAFRAAGMPAWGVPLLFTGVIVGAALVGAAVARWFSEPANRMLRRRLIEGSLGHASGAASGVLR